MNWKTSQFLFMISEDLTRLNDDKNTTKNIKNKSRAPSPI